MKTKDYMNELNAKSVDELQNELVAAKKELFNLRFQNATSSKSSFETILHLSGSLCIASLKASFATSSGKGALEYWVAVVPWL